MQNTLDAFVLRARSTKRQRLGSQPDKNAPGAKTEESSRDEAKDQAKDRDQTPKLVLVTGGARGADAVWTSVAGSQKLDVVVMSFQGHFVKSEGPCWVSVRKLPDDMLRKAIPDLELAASHMGRKPVFRGKGKLTSRQRLLCRNGWIVNHATHCYAIGFKLPEDRNRDASSGLDVGVQGGTAWACQMFTAKTLHAVQYAETTRTLKTDKLGNVPFRMWLFDQTMRCWFQGVLFRVMETEKWSFVWKHVRGIPSIPRHGRVALVGSRKITTQGREAIAQCFRGYGHSHG